MDHNGRVVTTKEAADGAEVTTADVLFPVETDHAITGWYADAAFNTPVTTVTIDKANVTLYAKVEAGHWLTFDSKGGSYVAPVFVPNGKTAAKPDDPTRPGYTFDGWDFDFTKELTANATATAKWTANDRTRSVSYTHLDVYKRQRRTSAQPRYRLPRGHDHSRAGGGQPLRTRQHPARNPDHRPGPHHRQVPGRAGGRGLGGPQPVLISSPGREKGAST